MGYLPAMEYCSITNLHDEVRRLLPEKSLVRQNNQFTVGLADTQDYNEMKKIIDSAYQPLYVNIGAVEAKK